MNRIPDGATNALESKDRVKFIHVYYISRPEHLQTTIVKFKYDTYVYVIVSTYGV